MIVDQKLNIIIYFPYSFRSEWRAAIRDKNCPCKINAVARSKHLTERLRVSNISITLNYVCNIICIERFNLMSYNFHRIHGSIY